MDEYLRLALFAPDYDAEVDREIVDLTFRRLSPRDRAVILSYDAEGSADRSTSSLSARGLILHGLAEVFEQRLTPLGMAVRRRIR